MCCVCVNTLRLGKVDGNRVGLVIFRVRNIIHTVYAIPVVASAVFAMQTFASDAQNLVADF